MLTQDQMPVGAIVSFDLHPAQIIGASHKNAKVLAIVDGDTAQSLGYDVRALHAAVYPTLPQGTPNRYNAYSYALLLLGSKQKTVVGLPWIKENSLQRVSVGRLQVILEGMSEQDHTRLVKALSANGFTVGSIDWI